MFFPLLHVNVEFRIVFAAFPRKSATAGKKQRDLMENV